MTHISPFRRTYPPTHTWVHVEMKLVEFCLFFCRSAVFALVRELVEEEPDRQLIHRIRAKIPPVSSQHVPKVRGKMLSISVWTQNWFVTHILAVTKHSKNIQTPWAEQFLASTTFYSDKPWS